MVEQGPGMGVDAGEACVIGIDCGTQSVRAIAFDSAGRKLAGAARATLGATGANLFVADGEVAFQDIPHFHVHVIPRYPNDGFGLTFPPTYDRPPSRAELETIATAIRGAEGSGPDSS